ncbi:MAG: hypothetical protein WCI31_11030 [Prolixibacteraceae bacterium]
MKKIVFTTVLILVVCLGTFAKRTVAEGDSNSTFGTYKIESLDDRFFLKDKGLEKYQITYQNSDLKVIVAIDKQKKCKKYYVLTEKLPVQYECNGTYFGIKRLDKNMESNGFSTSMSNLNKAEFYHQRVLTSELKGTIDHLNLIASYYPALLQEKVADLL